MSHPPMETLSAQSGRANWVWRIPMTTTLSPTFSLSSSTNMVGNGLNQSSSRTFSGFGELANLLTTLPRPIQLARCLSPQTWAVRKTWLAKPPKTLLCSGHRLVLFLLLPLALKVQNCLWVGCLATSASRVVGATWYGRTCLLSLQACGTMNSRLSLNLQLSWKTVSWSSGGDCSLRLLSGVPRDLARWIRTMVVAKLGTIQCSVAFRCVLEWIPAVSFRCVCQIDVQIHYTWSLWMYIRGVNLIFREWYWGLRNIHRQEKPTML